MKASQCPDGESLRLIRVTKKQEREVAAVPKDLYEALILDLYEAVDMDRLVDIGVAFGEVRQVGMTSG